MHQKRKTTLHNNNLNAAFVLDGITSLGYRIDGRAFGARRPLSFEFGHKDSHVVVHLGKTVVCACVAARIEQPMGSRSNEGSLRCVVRDSTLLSGRKQAGEQREVLLMYERFLDRSFKESKAVDLESLCIQSGKYAWYIELQLTVMSDDGNVLDALGYAALAALRVFKRPDVEISKGRGMGLKVYSIEEKEGVTMTLHHFPVAVTFALFRKEDGDTGREEEPSSATSLVVDPTDVEEVTSSGSMAISITPQGELCAVQKADGCGMGMSEVFGCMRRGMELAREGCDALEDALKKHEIDRVAARVKRHDGDVTVARMDVSQPVDAPLPEDVRRAIDASRVREEEGDDDDDNNDDKNDDKNDGDMDIPSHTTVAAAAVMGAHGAPDGKTGRRYKEGSSKKGRAIYKQASDAVRETAPGDIDTLGDALR